MINLFFIFFFGHILYIIAKKISPEKDKAYVSWIIVGGYATRLAIKYISIVTSEGKEVEVVDAMSYLRMASLFAKIWSFKGIHYLTYDDSTSLPILCALPINIFAFFIYIGNDISEKITLTTELTCTASVAFSACLASLNLYHLSYTCTGNTKKSLLSLLATTFFPSFISFTCDTTKEGFVNLFIVSTFASSIRLIKKIDIFQQTTIILSIIGLWYSRPYYVGIIPFILLTFILQTFQKKYHSFFNYSFFIVPILFLLIYTPLLSYIIANTEEKISDEAVANTISANSQGGSGILLASPSSRMGALHLKTIYFLFGPFPWDNFSSSIFFQLSKIENLYWLILFYQGIRGFIQLCKKDVFASLIVLFFLSFIIYLNAPVLSNLGLAVRMRIPFVLLVTGFLTCWNSEKKKEEQSIALSVIKPK
ncbi:hypothetical protein [Pajaroellobacter abortibovis]|uniref:Glycosyltransferase RgtA/B/C/D-like domain-containing protein n=1 Tax=Pajaroellobacter abortibovis TaxID=1882918 RepID=A0A1L6MVR1_9BACT|nr:hypothetical protein [Pajaroellobacter abortibovis]APR99606.1 hypothetical protein BCY86_02110 [Pajaroellobacter abortibovis]